MDRNQGLFPDLPFVRTLGCFPYWPQTPGKDCQREEISDDEECEERAAIFRRYDPGEIDRSKCGQEAVSGQDPRNQSLGSIEVHWIWFIQRRVLSYVFSIAGS